MRARLTLLSILLATGASGADPGYVRNWIDAQGGCRMALPALQAVNFGRQKQDEFLDKLLAEWTDGDIREFRSVYAECYAITNTPYGIRPDPQNVNVLQFTQKKVDELRSVIESERSAVKVQTVTAEARKRQVLENEAATVARTVRKRTEEETSFGVQAETDKQRYAQLKQDAEQAEKLRYARLEAAKAHAKHEDEVAAEIERQAEAEEKALAEVRNVSDAARARRQAAEQRLAQVRAGSENQRKQAEVPRSSYSTNRDVAKADVPPVSTQAAPEATEAPAIAATGCEKPGVRKFLIQEFNRAAERKDLPAAIDLIYPETEEFTTQEDGFTAICRYVVQLDNGKHQRFRLSVRKNSLGSPYISFKPQSQPF